MGTGIWGQKSGVRRAHLLDFLSIFDNDGQDLRKAVLRLAGCGLRLAGGARRWVIFALASTDRDSKGRFASASAIMIETRVRIMEKNMIAKRIHVSTDGSINLCSGP